MASFANRTDAQLTYTLKDLTRRAGKAGHPASIDTNLLAVQAEIDRRSDKAIEWLLTVRQVGLANANELFPPEPYER